MSTEHLAALERDIGYEFQDPDLIAHALTHSSTGRDVNYERLEFLGDRVLGLIIASILYEKFPDEPEGDLAKRLAALVEGRHLAKMARKIELGSYIDFSKAEEQAGGRNNDNILADVFESLIGALYLDGGLPPCSRLIETLWSDSFYEMKKPPQHPKTVLQEWLQSKGLPLPVYEMAGQEGPDHAPVFRIRLSIDGYAGIEAQGRSRQEAEREAARLFMAKIEAEGS